MRYIYAVERKTGGYVVAKKEKTTKRCEYCGAEYKTHQVSARFCKTSHRVYAFRKAQIERLRTLERKT